jgi:hypothetical protein
LKVSCSTEFPRLLVFYGSTHLDWWNSDFLEPLVLQVFPVCSSGITKVRYCLVFEGEKNFFQLVEMKSVEEKAAI